MFRYSRKLWFSADRSLDDIVFDINQSDKQTVVTVPETDVIGRMSAVMTLFDFIPPVFLMQQRRRLSICCRHTAP
jgi:hypothetical protein